MDISGIIRDMENPPFFIEGATQRLEKGNGIEVPKQVLENVRCMDDPQKDRHAYACLSISGFRQPK
jgi:hypothetical protein